MRMIDIIDQKDRFTPPRLLRGAMMQTLIASQKFRKHGVHPMEEAAQSMTLNCGPHNGEENVRLIGQFSKAPNATRMAILLHGWEGSQDSTYVISTARLLFENGISVFRLNLRDHGPSHHLNIGLFNANLFSEVFTAMKLATQTIGLPAYLIGFSLGGNFMLRVAREMITTPLDDIAHIFSISPVINPAQSATQSDVHPLVRKYFIKKWRTSLEKKQAAFPDIYNFEATRNFKSISDFSNYFIENYSDFASLDDFFNGYRLWPEDIAACKTPISIIMAKDDPVVIASDVLTLKRGINTKLFYHDHGGHNGFFESLRGPTWYDRYILRAMH